MILKISKHNPDDLDTGDFLTFQLYIYIHVDVDNCMTSFGFGLEAKSLRSLFQNVQRSQINKTVLQQRTKTD